ncbi:MAG TPA: hypothetical protein VFG68_21675 [Fimbriiglobus sp.]|nr:hypothetical protein [Fimbriiglobus sp.]
MQRDIASAAWGSGPYSQQHRTTGSTQQQAVSSAPPTTTATSPHSKSGREPKKIDYWAGLAFFLIVGGVPLGLALWDFGPVATAQGYAVALVRSACLALLLAGVGVLVKWLTKKKGSGREHAAAQTEDKPDAFQRPTRAEKDSTSDSQSEAQPPDTNGAEAHRLELPPRVSVREAITRPTGGSSQGSRHDGRGCFVAAAVASVIGYAVLGMILPLSVTGVVIKMLGGIAIGIGSMLLAKAGTRTATSYRAELFWIAVLVADGLFGVADAINNSSVFQLQAEAPQHESRRGLTIAEVLAQGPSTNPDDYPTLQPYSPNSLGGRDGLPPPGWSDQSIPLGARLSSFIRVRGRDKLRTWDEIASEAKSLFRIDPEKLRRRFELEVAREIAKNNREPLHIYIIRRSVPIVSAYVNMHYSQEYKAARERFAQGKATGSDVGLIANYERLQEIARGVNEAAD